MFRQMLILLTGHYQSDVSSGSYLFAIGINYSYDVYILPIDLRKLYELQAFVVLLFCFLNSVVFLIEISVHIS